MRVQSIDHPDAPYLHRSMTGDETVAYIWYDVAGEIVSTRYSPTVTLNKLYPTNGSRTLEVSVASTDAANNDAIILSCIGVPAPTSLNDAQRAVSTLLWTGTATFGTFTQATKAHPLTGELVSGSATYRLVDTFALSVQSTGTLIRNSATNLVATLEFDPRNYESIFVYVTDSHSLGNIDIAVRRL